jgi:hypothetical protein
MQCQRFFSHQARFFERLAGGDTSRKIGEGHAKIA